MGGHGADKGGWTGGVEKLFAKIMAIVFLKCQNFGKRGILRRPGGFAVVAEPARRPGERPREGVSSKNGKGA